MAPLRTALLHMVAADNYQESFTLLCFCGGLMVLPKTFIIAYGLVLGFPLVVYPFLQWFVGLVFKGKNLMVKALDSIININQDLYFMYLTMQNHFLMYRINRKGVK